ncbi:MAG: zeta toxin family protein [Candidatus Omnitrophica bacterium]|nr:zeta toxin family protein [Candidatus Omnitrophota bacterium]
MPKLYIVAGPNGAGKTTFAKEFLPHYAHCSKFVNADLIASGLAPFSPASMSIKAGRLLLGQIQTFLDAKADFAFESTLAGRSYVPLIKEAKKNGYSLTIFFLWIPNAQLAHARIRQRVKQGGHDIPREDVVRRFGRSRDNFGQLYQSLCDSWLLFDNSGAEPKEIARYDQERLNIMEKDLFEKFQGQIK